MKEAENSDLLDVLKYVFNSKIKPIAVPLPALSKTSHQNKQAFSRPQGLIST